MILFMKKMKTKEGKFFHKPVYHLTNKAGMAGSCSICPFLVPITGSCQGQEPGHGASVKLHQNIITDMKILMRYILAWMGAAGIMNVYFSRSVMKYLS